MPKIDIAKVPADTECLYPDPFHEPIEGRARQRLGKPSEPVEVPSGEWPAPLFALHVGKATPETVLAAATNEGRRVEALFQLERWRDVVDSAPPALIEYAAARNELARR